MKGHNPFKNKKEEKQLSSKSNTAFLEIGSMENSCTHDCDCSHNKPKCDCDKNK